MTVNIGLKEPHIRQLNLKRFTANKINRIINQYKTQYDIESIYFDYPIDGIIYHKNFPHYSDNRFVHDWDSTAIKGTTLIKVLKCLNRKEFFGYCRTTENKLIKIKPKKNVK
jgi:hypothetical protein